MTVAFLGLGSNINPEKNIFEAVKLLATHVNIAKASKLYLTEPLEARIQSNFWNCVLKIDTRMEPLRLKQDVLRNIEDTLGRTRAGDKYASRTIDIDLILYGDLSIQTNDLVLPDPAIRERAFLAVPLCEIQPELLMPDTKEAVCEIAEKLGTKGMRELSEGSQVLKQLIAGSRVKKP